eukprot:scaffold97737_cov98-Attheya_sp.AAC.1
MVGNDKDPKHSLYQRGTMHWRNAPLLQQVQLPLNCLQLSSGWMTTCSGIVFVGKWGGGWGRDMSCHNK